MIIPSGMSWYLDSLTPSGIANVLEISKKSVSTHNLARRIASWLGPTPAPRPISGSRDNRRFTVGATCEEAGEVTPGGR